MKSPKENPTQKPLKPLNNKTIVEYDKLTDPPSKLFRNIAMMMGLNVASWKSYIDDYIRKTYPDNPDSMDVVKRERSTAIGNINDTLWMSTKLSFGKMLTGLAILRAKRITISLKVEMESGKVYETEYMTDVPSTKAKSK